MNFFAKIYCIALFFILQIHYSTCGQNFGNSVSIDNWHFHLGDVHLGGREFLDHTDWDQVTVPHDWSVQQPASPGLASCTGYLPGGVAWYRTSLDLELLEENEERYYLYFEGVYKNSEVFFNGKWLGKRPNGYVPFIYEITDYVKSGNNVIAVKVNHNDDADSRWYTGSGIYRKVHLVKSKETHFSAWSTFYQSTGNAEKAEIELTTEIDNFKSQTFEVSHELIDLKGNLVAKANTGLLSDQNTKASIVVNQPHLWSVDDPYLYKLKTKLIKDGQVWDQNEITVGIRYLNYDPNKGFALNGTSMKIKGVCLHHDAGVLGAAVPKSIWRERLLRLKEIGVNGIRMSHNPQATDLYDLCDELGFLVMDEAFDEWEYPKKKWIKGWNVGEPGFQGAADYFREWWKVDLEAMVLRDRNHPSIIMWSIGNEVDYPNDPYSHPIMSNAAISQIFVKGYLKDNPHADRLGDIAKELSSTVRQLDKSRPVTAALAGVIMSNETAYPGALDIVGYNYTESRYDLDHKLYPNRVIYGSETRHDLEAWKAVRDNEFIFGQFIWTGLDYLGESGKWPSRGFTTGMIDLANNIKPRGYFRKSLWSNEPMVYVGSYIAKNEEHLSIDAPNNWNYKTGQKVRVVAYTNTDRVALFLNGQKIGKTKKYDEATGVIYWDVPFDAGELKAVAYEGKTVVAKSKIMTAESPVKIEIERIDTEKLEAGNVLIFAVEAKDEKGKLSKLASNEIIVQLEGDAKLLGIENATNNVAEVMTSHQRNLKNGRATVYVQVTTSEGFTIDISSPYLQGVSKKISSGDPLN
ncbi:glycoside hydrolase family 2 TIM barrel-domain containing protein [Flammeovirga sp. EKP202]|uniref:glycoside hydrolase family 2 TIM barrel-domain containing protein n=1 Tax=Flammeovirga sp. EKP202 TaxID=2770592 RepID=UPI00165EE8FA|nr:glycoside hydrolase family 2 TIM barrel-domain containing protein [Flammeovirga sp. EKP202]MBD0404669.1 DUF4982 domain-containing protein [Flammeovirga sp. EKP202]